MLLPRLVPRHCMTIIKDICRYNCGSEFTVTTSAKQGDTALQGSEGSTPNICWAFVKLWTHVCCACSDESFASRTCLASLKPFHS